LLSKAQKFQFRPINQFSKSFLKLFFTQNLSHDEASGDFKFSVLEGDSQRLADFQPIIEHFNIFGAVVLVAAVVVVVAAAVEAMVVMVEVGTD